MLDDCGGCSVAQSCRTLCDPINSNAPGFPILNYLPELAQTHSIESVMPSNLCHPRRLLTSIFPSIKVFSNKLALHIRWPEYWNISASVLPMNIQG